MVSLMIDLALQPLITGSMLYLLTKAPMQYREPAVQFLASRLSDAANSRVLIVLKTLCTLGVIRTVNAYLNKIALSHWTVLSKTNQWNWHKEVAVVTGGSMGIGKGVVDDLYARGIKIAVLDVAPAPKDHQEKDRILYIKCDVSSHAAVQEAARTIRQRFGDPTILVNNAGIHKLQSVLEIPIEYLEKEIAVNLTSHWYTVKEFLPYMIKINKGHIVGVASMASFIQTSGIMPYAATKAGVYAFQEGLAMELRHIFKASGVQVTTVHPSYVETPLVASFEKDTNSKVDGQMTIEYLGRVIGDQVASGRGAQLILPDRWYIKVATLLRSWPNWMQVALSDLMTNYVDTFTPTLRKRYMPPN